MPKVTKQTMMAKRVSSSQDAWDLADDLKILLYGQSGTGKTTLWATFPGPILAIITSGSKRPGELKSINTPEYRKKITAVCCTTEAQVQEQIERAEAGEFRTVVQDHGTGLQDMLLREELGLEHLPQQKSFGMATREQYGLVASRTKEILHRLLSLSCNTILVAQEKNHNEDDSDPEGILAPVIGGAFSKSVIRWLNPACDYVLQTFKRAKYVEKKTTINGKTKTMRVKVPGVEYCLRTAPHEVYCTKFRVPKGHFLPEVIVDPSYGKLMSVIEGKE